MAVPMTRFPTYLFFLFMLNKSQIQILLNAPFCFLSKISERLTELGIRSNHDRQQLFLVLLALSVGVLHLLLFLVLLLNVLTHCDDVKAYDFK